MHREEWVWVSGCVFIECVHVPMGRRVMCAAVCVCVHTLHACCAVFGV